MESADITDVRRFSFPSSALIGVYLRNNGLIECDLCPRHCHIADGKHGTCLVRQRSGDELITASYGLISGLAVDPIEKKPLYHFLPGSNVLSFGTVGCNLTCKFCQNDSPAEIDAMTQWAVSNLGPDVPWHFSAYRPTAQWHEAPLESLLQAKSIAECNGLKHVHLGNIHLHPTT